MTADEIIAAIAPAVPGATYEALVSADAAVTPTILVPREQLLPTCRALQGPGLEFVAFSDVTAVDFHPARTPRPRPRNRRSTTTRSPPVASPP